MPILSDVQHDFFSEETDAESPVSTQLMQKIGENIMFLNGLLGIFQTFTSSTTYQIPEGITRGYIFAAGAGGGGGGGSGAGGGAGGGAGVLPVVFFALFTPLETITITIGAGGSGGIGGTNGTNGSAGGSTIISTAARTFTLTGGSGGIGQNNAGTGGQAGVGTARVGSLSCSGGAVGSLSLIHI